MKKDYIYFGGIAFLIFYLFKCYQANKSLAEGSNLTFGNQFMDKSISGWKTGGDFDYLKNNGMQFADHKGKEIMKVRKNKYQDQDEFHLDHKVFYSLKDAKFYIDNKY